MALLVVDDEQVVEVRQELVAQADVVPHVFKARFAEGPRLLQSMIARRVNAEKREQEARPDPIRDERLGCVAREAARIWTIERDSAKANPTQQVIALRKYQRVDMLSPVQIAE